jgi:hypothetical protein
LLPNFPQLALYLVGLLVVTTLAAQGGVVVVAGIAASLPVHKIVDIASDEPKSVNSVG